MDWHRNAPIAVYDDEPPRIGWHEIIMLAERLTPVPSLLPKNSAARAELFGLITEIASENGFAWQRRLQLIKGLINSSDRRFQSGGKTLALRYGYSKASLENSSGRAIDILKMLSDKLQAQKSMGSYYFVGDELAAADIYWACFSQLVAPLDKDVNRMSDVVRDLYHMEGSENVAVVDPILLAHRDRIYEKYLSLPLDF